MREINELERAIKTIAFQDCQIIVLEMANDYMINGKELEEHVCRVINSKIENERNKL